MRSTQGARSIDIALSDADARVHRIATTATAWKRGDAVLRFASRHSKIRAREDLVALAVSDFTWRAAARDCVLCPLDVERRPPTGEATSFGEQWHRARCHARRCRGNHCHG